MTIEVRAMLPGDLDAVMAILKHWNLAPIAPSVASPYPERTELLVENALVAVDGDRVVGVRSYIPLSPTVVEGASFAVAPDCLRLGIGRKLQVAAYRQMYQRGIRAIRSETDRPEHVQWLVRRGHRVVRTTSKRHAFGLAEVDHWTVLEFDFSMLPELEDLRRAAGDDHA